MQNPELVYAADQTISHREFWAAIFGEVRAEIQQEQSETPEQI
jgi:hypothetical protein